MRRVRPAGELEGAAALDDVGEPDDVDEPAALVLVDRDAVVGAVAVVEVAVTVGSSPAPPQPARAPATMRVIGTLARRAKGAGATRGVIFVT